MKKVSIRNQLRDGDISEIAALHETLYSEEYDYNQEFADYVAGILMEFGRPHTDKEKLWIVERDEKIMGCLAVVQKSEDTAQVRRFLVHPDLRGKGLGSKLFKEAVDFIRESGYSSAFLTPQKHLVVKY